MCVAKGHLLNLIYEFRKSEYQLDQKRGTITMTS